MIKDNPAIHSFVSASDANKVIFARECLVEEWISSIHQQMESQGTTQAQIAERVGLSRAAISKMLRGPANVKVDGLIRIGLAIGLTWTVEARAADPAICIPAKGESVGRSPTQRERTGAEMLAWLDDGMRSRAGTPCDAPPAVMADAYDDLAA